MTANPSNSDLVGEATRLSAEMESRPHVWPVRVRTLLPELAQQLEQAKAESEELYTLLGRTGLRAGEIEHGLILLRDERQRAALTTPDSATEQEEG